METENVLSHNLIGRWPDRTLQCCWQVTCVRVVSLVHMWCVEVWYCEVVDKSVEPHVYLSGGRETEIERKVSEWVHNNICQREREKWFQMSNFIYLYIYSLGVVVWNGDTQCSLECGRDTDKSESVSLSSQWRTRRRDDSGIIAGEKTV